MINPSTFNAAVPPSNIHHRQGDRLKSTEPTHLTISDDRTNQLSIDERNLSALCSQDKVELDDYQKQLVILEQQNKKRLKIHKPSHRPRWQGERIMALLM